MNTFLCCFFKSFIDAARKEGKKRLSSPRKLILVNFKVSEMTMKVSSMAGSSSRKSRSSLETFLSNHRPRQVCLAALGNNSGVA